MAINHLMCFHFGRGFCALRLPNPPRENGAVLALRSRFLNQIITDGIYRTAIQIWNDDIAPAFNIYE